MKKKPSLSASQLSFLSSTNRSLVFGLSAWLLTSALLFSSWGLELSQQATQIAELNERLGLGKVDLSQQKDFLFFKWQSTALLLLWISSAFLLLRSFFWSHRPSTSVQQSVRTKLRKDEVSPPKRLDDTENKNTAVEPDANRPSASAAPQKSEKVESKNSLVEIKPYLEKIVKSWEQNHKARVLLSTQLEALKIEADPHDLQVILKNLLENALQHAQADETLELQISSQELSPDQAIVVISDNGKGYEGNPQELGQLFHKGSQSAGSGVGLYLIRVLMERMGGKVQFCSQLQNEHSGFTTELRFKRIEEASA